MYTVSLYKDTGFVFVASLEFNSLLSEVVLLRREEFKNRILKMKVSVGLILIAFAVSANAFPGNRQYGGGGHRPHGGGGGYNQGGYNQG